MKDFLQDLVSHIHTLGFLPLIKVSATTTETAIQAMAIDRSVIVDAKTKTAVDGLDGVFGMPNLNKLELHLKCPEYRTGEIISIVKDKIDPTVLRGLHFQNAAGDFENNYRFMDSNIINEKLKSVKFKGASWNIEFTPSIMSIQRLKLQAAAHSEERLCQFTTKDDNLLLSFGDESTHAGQFVFQPNITGKLKTVWLYPVSQVLSILELNGEITIRISDSGAMQITVDSGIAEYNYILPAQVK